ncbi:hypothetical protein [Nonomuraea sp. NPDC049695]|uniref:hypothetical protein n=1 Tax=Nonomuraea sp. NPDC049695 TaxID=3154734 RepID=UPI0034270565
MPSRAARILLPMEGFVWSANAGLGSLPVHGFDRYRAGAGKTRQRHVIAADGRVQSVAVSRWGNTDKGA